MSQNGVLPRCNSKASFFSLVLLILLLCPTQLLGEVEEILNYDVNINILESSELLVTEKIRVYSLGRAIKRGIFREFPTKYQDFFGRNYNIGFQVLEVLRDGIQEPYHINDKSNGRVIYIGEKNTFLNPGIYEYSLTFKTNRQLGFFKDKDELYYNATGHGWDFPIRESTVRVRLPESSVTAINSLDGFTGPVGSTQKNFMAEIIGGSEARFYLSQPLSPRGGFTVIVSFPKGVVRAPTTFDEFKYFVKDNVDTTFAFFGLLLLWAFYLRAWRLYGRDPARGTIVPLFEAPQGITPMGIRYVLDMGFSDRCLIAGVYQLALKGALVIEDDDHGKFRLSKRAEYIDNLSREEREVFDALLPSWQDSLTLESENHLVFESAKTQLQKSLELKHLKKTFFANSKIFNQSLFFILAIVSAIWGLNSFDMREVFQINNNILFAVFILSSLLFHRLIKAPTKAGRKIMDRIEGYKMYLETAEEDRLRTLSASRITPELYERHLPYAVALGVDQEWTERFMRELGGTGERPDNYQPSWYRGSKSWRDRGAFRSQSLSTSISSAIVSSTRPPGSSSSGGSSGGGGGGGGGGGW